MATAIWQCSVNGRYWLDVLVGGRQVSLMIDTGLVDPEQRVGMELEPQLFDQLEQSERLTGRALRVRKDAGGTARRCFVPRLMRVWQLQVQANRWVRPSAFMLHAELKAFPVVWDWRSSTNFLNAESFGTARQKRGRCQ